MTIDYVYDPLYRIREANYSTGDFYHYNYDAVGNRLSEMTQLVTKNYAYDNANRLVDVDETAYTFDANGNLLNDGVNTYAYDSANRLTSVLVLRPQPMPTTDLATGFHKTASITLSTSTLV